MAIYDILIYDDDNIFGEILNRRISLDIEWFNGGNYLLLSF